MTTELVTLATFDSSIQAELAKAALAEAGIDAQLGDEHGLLSNTAGGITLVVRQEDAERAVTVIRGIESDMLTGSVVDEDELTRQALAAVPEDGPVEPDEETKE